MRLAFGWFSRLLAVALLAAAVAVTARLAAEGALSGRRLGAALDSAWRWLRAVDLDALASPPVAAGFVLGLPAGWALALFWIGRRLRRGSLLLADLRDPDIAFAEGVRHVRAHSASEVPDDEAAAALLLDAADGGRLALWRPGAAGLLRRVTRGQLRAGAAGRMGELRLLRADVERMWPKPAAAATIESRPRFPVRPRERALPERRP